MLSYVRFFYSINIIYAELSGLAGGQYTNGLHTKPGVLSITFSYANGGTGAGYHTHHHRSIGDAHRGGHLVWRWVLPPCPTGLPLHKPTQPKPKPRTNPLYPHHTESKIDHSDTICTGASFLKITEEHTLPSVGSGTDVDVRSIHAYVSYRSYSGGGHGG